MSLTLQPIEELSEIKLAVKIIKSTDTTWLERDINSFLHSIYEDSDKYDIKIHQVDVKISHNSGYLGIIRYSKLLKKTKVSLEK